MGFELERDSTAGRMKRMAAARPTTPQVRRARHTPISEIAAAAVGEALSAANAEAPSSCWLAGCAEIGA